jgi:hypothetical protein
MIDIQGACPAMPQKTGVGSLVCPEKKDTVTRRYKRTIPNAGGNVPNRNQYHLFSSGETNQRGNRLIPGHLSQQLPCSSQETTLGSCHQLSSSL